MFKPGSANTPATQVPSKADSERRDEYEGRYKDAADGVSEEDKFGTALNPIQNDALPAKGLKSIGG